MVAVAVLHESVLQILQLSEGCHGYKELSPYGGLSLYNTVFYPRVYFTVMFILKFIEM
jgi:hypothetical protein